MGKKKGKQYQSASGFKVGAGSPGGSNKGTSSTVSDLNRLQGDTQTLSASDPASRKEQPDDIVWTLPGLSRADFYAASEFLRRHGKNQGLTRQLNTRNVTIGVQAHTCTPLQQKTLDHVALLFARVKRTTPSTGPPEHVTATALRKGRDGFEIWIAKNHGPQGEDESFRKNLELYFNGKGLWAKKPYEMTSDMVRFWKERLDHYISHIKMYWSRLKKAAVERDVGLNDNNTSQRKLTGVDLTYEVLLDLYHKEMVFTDLFKEDWQGAKKFCAIDFDTLQDQHYADETFLPISIGRQSYEIDFSKQGKDEAHLAETFSKLLKAINLLGTIASAQKAFAEFRKTLEGTGPITLGFLAPKQSLDLDRGDQLAISERLGQWAESGLDSTFRERAEAMAENIKNQPSYHRYFHCELQILDKFLDDEDAYDYIGCSKLSCYICWGVLQGTPFRTRDTHANLWSACAFPFDLKGQKGASRYQLLLALKKVQDYMVERVLRNSLETEFHFPAHHSLPETMAEGQTPERSKKTTRKIIDERERTVYVTRARALLIPAHSKPVSAFVNFCVSDELYYALPKQRKIAPYTWWLQEMQVNGPAKFPRSEVTHAHKVYTESSTWTEEEIIICARRNLHSDIKVNKWYADLIRDFHQRSVDPDNESCKWRGDIYIYRTTRDPDVQDLQDLESIEENEWYEVLRKCRDRLGRDWHSGSMDFLDHITLGDNLSAF
ncbi:hypothetical protein IQ07DRAFT_596566 [Pyrenochaeta sp. DS3sAY3a]|nr:hypothetical protein IQ07DRAFT_596566 [Pyrenochaeta sp. DS3sAY3a]